MLPWMSPAIDASSAQTVKIAGYVGPGDIKAATLWWGLRAYKNATIGANLVNIVRASDSANQDFTSLTDGTLDIASIATFIAPAPGGGVFNELYEQVSGTNHLTHPTNAPDYLASGLNTFSAAVLNAPVGLQAMLTLSNAGISQPLSIFIVMKHTDTSTTPTQNICGGDLNIGWIGSAIPDNPYVYAGGGAGCQGTASDLHWHTICGTINTGSSGTANIYVDGSLSAGPTTNVGTGGINAIKFNVGGGVGNYANMNFIEVGIYNSELTSTEVSNLHSNVVSFYGALP